MNHSNITEHLVAKVRKRLYHDNYFPDCKNHPVRHSEYGSFCSRCHHLIPNSKPQQLELSPQQYPVQLSLFDFSD